MKEHDTLYTINPMTEVTLLRELPASGSHQSSVYKITEKKAKIKFITICSEYPNIGGRVVKNSHPDFPYCIIY